MKSRKALIIIAITAAIVTAITASYYPHFAPPSIKASTTTSLYTTGLLEELADKFRLHHSNVIIKFIPVGTGHALEMAERGDVDMVFVHAPQLEKQYIEKGVLVEGHIMAYNYFIIVGPKTDPAKIKGLEDPIEAFRKIYNAGVQGKALFISRGDKSGTHVKELLLWNKLGLNPQGQEWYIESGQGMAKTLLLANEKGAYTLSDIGTFLKLKCEGRLDQLEILVSGGKELINIYSVYLVNPEKFNTNYELAKEFMEFVLSDEGQSIIESYGMARYNTSLFYSAKSNLEMLEAYWHELASGE